ncbi:MFS transporter [Pediococcus pentosaceus]|jgi:hypothetical protein|uniref:MFS transporter n=1 Tax=Pediococcus pentosaceus CGMCC 7049 TaxID=1460385 RepID=A0AAU7NKL7_PEDPE|nr:hypothetical protein [Pediococcus pentosaceus]KRN49486.1 hypothetical protein IV86_GL000281 [Pediococcus pentosaceus]MCE5959551.1 MFS transporter [Pediococcus pentosaceus]MCG7197423.1 MFS transporter [Pediococcus pentosaceus]MCI1594112.1 MFS transporter [Pediococcus pentosaceus]MCI2397095.1 MFS transporter [Pediococcus pentosaceus]
MKFKERTMKNPNVGTFLVILITGLLLTMPQILNKSIILGADAIFHFNRLYDIAMQFDSGNFSYFTSNYGFQQTARIVNAVYGPGLAYILGFILFICRSWLKFQVISSLLLFLISGYTMNYLSTSVGLSRKVANMNSMLFMSSFWVMGWTVSQMFMPWGIAVAPLIVAVGIKFIKSDKFTIVELSISVSLMIQIHMLSAVISVFILFLFFIIGIINVKDKLTLCVKVIAAAGLTLLLTFNVWGSILEIYIGNKLYPPFAANLAMKTMNLSVGNADFNHIGIIVSVLFAFEIAITIMNWSILSLTTKAVTGIGTVMLVLSSNIMPWMVIGRKIPMLNSFLQFPSRLEGFAFVLLLVGLGLCIEEVNEPSFKKYTKLFLMIATLFSVVQSYYNVQSKSEGWNGHQPIANRTNVIVKNNASESEIRNAFRSNDLSKGIELAEKPTTDYVPINVNNTDNGKSQSAYETYAALFINSKQGVKKEVKNGKLIVSWYANHKGESKKIPITVYKNTILLMNGSKLLKGNITLGTMNMPTIKATQSGKNVLTVSYKSSFINGWIMILTGLLWFSITAFKLVMGRKR